MSIVDKWFITSEEASTFFRSLENVDELHVQKVIETIVDYGNLSQVCSLTTSGLVLDGNILEKIYAKYFDSKFLCEYVASSPNVNTETLRHILTRKSIRNVFKAIIAKNTHTAPELFLPLFENTNSIKVKANIVSNPSVPEKILDYIYDYSNSDSMIVASIAANPAVTEKMCIKILDEDIIKNNMSNMMLDNFLNNPNITSLVLDKVLDKIIEINGFSKDPDDYFIKKILIHNEISTGALEKVLNLPNEMFSVHVFKEILDKLCTKDEYKNFPVEWVAAHFDKEQLI